MTVSCSLSFNVAVFAICHPLQRTAWLALATRTDHNNLAISLSWYRCNWYESAFRNLHKPMTHGHFERAYHAAAIDCHFAAMVHSGIHNHLYAVHIGAEHTDENTAGSLIHDVFKALLDGAFTRRATSALNSGRFTQ
jgi:hypothetical protein